MTTPPPWTPGLRCSCGEKVLAVGLTPSELHAIVADDLDEPASPRRCSRGAAAAQHLPPPGATAAAGTEAAEPLQAPGPPLPLIRRSSSLGDLQQLAALMALQQEPSQHGLELSIEPATPLMSERPHGSTPPSQSGRAGSAGSAGSGTQGGTHPQQGSPRCSLTTSSTSRFESVNRVATVAGKEYSHRRSGERQRRSRDRERRWSDEQPSAAAAASPVHPHRHSRLGGVEGATQPAWQLQPPGRLAGSTAAQRLADLPLLPPEDASAEYSSSGVAAWLADSAAATGGAAHLIGPDAVLHHKVPPAVYSRGHICSSAAQMPAEAQPQLHSRSAAALAKPLPATAAAVPKAVLAPAQVAAPRSSGGGGQANASLAAASTAPPSVPDAPASTPAAGKPRAVEPAACGCSSSAVANIAAQPSDKPAKASWCGGSSDAGAQASCAALNLLTLLARLLRF